MEGITFSLYESIELFHEAGKSVDTVVSIGGELKMKRGFKCRLIFSIRGWLS